MWKCLFDFFHVQIEKRFLCHSIFATSLKNELFLTPNENVYMLYISTSFWFSICCAKKLKKQKMLSKILQKNTFLWVCTKMLVDCFIPPKISFFLCISLWFCVKHWSKYAIWQPFSTFYFHLMEKVAKLHKAGFIQWWSGCRPAICTMKYTTCDFVTQSQTAFFHEWV